MNRMEIPCNALYKLMDIEIFVICNAIAYTCIQKYSNILINICAVRSSYIFSLQAMFSCIENARAVAYIPTKLLNGNELK